MDTTLGIKNFRIFDENGASIAIKPITILTGCNSSGKSSAVKALLCIQDYLRTDRIHVDRKPLSLLGNFESVINKKCLAAGNDTVSFSYTADSFFFGKELTIELEFGVEPADMKKEGFLKRAQVKNKDGKILWVTNKFRRIMWEPSILNVKLPDDLSQWKKDFFAFRLTYELLRIANSIHTSVDILGDMPKEKGMAEMDKVKKDFQELKHKLGEERVLRVAEWYSLTLNENKRRYGDFYCQDASLVEAAMDADILTYLPILSDLDAVAPNDFDSFFSNLFCIKEPKHEGDRMRNKMVERVCQAYHNSGTSLFSVFYRNLENEFLDNAGFLSLDEMHYPTQLKDVETVEDLTNSDETDAIVPENMTAAALFHDVFYLLTSVDNEKNTPYISYSPQPGYSDWIIRDHRLLMDFVEWRKYGINDIVSNNICDSLRYVGSTRIDIKRFYDINPDDDFGKTLSEYFESIRTNKWEATQRINKQMGSDFLSFKPGSFINKWIKGFGIGDRIAIEPVENGIGYMIKIYAEESDTDGRLLADYGYGISQLVSILLEIETAIMRAKIELDSAKVVDYTKGVLSLSALFGTSPDTQHFAPSTIAIEEPEIHLHPRYQSLLAEMFVDAYHNYGVQFIVETHSEYLVRKIQTMIGGKMLSTQSISILYVEDTPKNVAQRIRQIPVAEDGRLREPFGSGFFDEADSLAMNLLTIKGCLE